MATLADSRLGQYTILEQIGKGGMSIVFRGVQASIGREVAIKILLGSLLARDSTFKERFFREVQVSAMLQHPHILPVYDFGEQNGQPFIVMAYLRGGSLSDRIQQGPMSLSEVLPVVTQIAGALDFAHARGVIHRDVKPGNVMLDEQGNTYLTDFGLAKVSDAALQLTGSALMGTPDYMAPDLADAQGLSPAVDIYALGVALFQMLTGHVPYQASTPMGVLMAHLNNPIPDVRLERPDLPEAVQQVIATSMAKTAKERYATPGNLADALRAAAKEPQHTPHGLLFTDVQGRVIFVNNHLLKLLNRAETEARRIVGRPMHELLGIEPEAARLLVQDIGKIGRVYSRPLEARDAHGSSILLLCTGEATYDDKGVCIGADLSLRSTAEPATAAPSTPQAASYDTSEKSYIQLYFTSQIDALRVLLVRVGGPRLGNTLDRIIQETSERNGWPVVVHDGRVEADLRRVEVLVYHALLAKAVAYVVSVVGPALVERQMSLVDAHMGPRSLELASQMGLRELLHSSH